MAQTVIFTVRRPPRRLLRRLFPLEVGATGPLRLRQDTVPLGLARPVRLLYASDLHLGHAWTAGVPGQVLAAAREARPDVVLLGGDLADTPRAVDALHRLVRVLTEVAPTGAVAGNHDRHAGVAQVRAAVESAGGCWLPANPLAAPVAIDGACRAAPQAGPRVLCAHFPSVFPAAHAAGYGLVLAGHLHGGQCVLVTRGGRQFPAAWFHRWHGLRFAQGATTMLVSRGVADTLPLRFNCPREVVVCDVV